MYITVRSRLLVTALLIFALAIIVLRARAWQCQGRSRIGEARGWNRSPVLSGAPENHGFPPEGIVRRVLPVGAGAMHSLVAVSLERGGRARTAWSPVRACNVQSSHASQTSIHPFVLSSTSRTGVEQATGVQSLSQWTTGLPVKKAQQGHVCLQLQMQRAANQLTLEHRGRPVPSQQMDPPTLVCSFQDELRSSDLHRRAGTASLVTTGSAADSRHETSGEVPRADGPLPLGLSGMLL